MTESGGGEDDRKDSWEVSGGSEDYRKDSWEVSGGGVRMAERTAGK